MIELTREIRLALVTDPAVDPDAKGANSWGGWPTTTALQAHLRLRGTVSGKPDPQTGYLCNIRDLDRALRDAVTDCLLSSEKPPPTGAETAIQAIWARLTRSEPGLNRVSGIWQRLVCVLSPTLSVMIEREHEPMVTLTQQFEFSAAHRLHCPTLSDEQNREIFGKCNNPNGHGHNYIVEVTIGGVPDTQSGHIMPLTAFEQIVRVRVIDRFDHRHLNLDTSEFATLNPSVENIAMVIHGILAQHLPDGVLRKVRVYETPKTFAEYGDTIRTSG